VHRNIADVEAKEVSQGLWERTLLRPEDTTHGQLTIKHFTIKPGSSVSFTDELVEYQHYVISGCAYWYRTYHHSDTAIFIPGNRAKHSIAQAGESDLIMLTHIYKIPKPTFRWGKARAFNYWQAQYLHEAGAGAIAHQLITEEQHAVSGAYRMHALDVQTNPPRNDLPAHTNPEETMYFLRGTGEALSEGRRERVRPGSLIYTPVGVEHGIFNTHDSLPLQYVVVEYIEHDKAWTERGYQAPSLTHEGFGDVTLEKHGGSS